MATMAKVFTLIFVFATLSFIQGTLVEDLFEPNAYGLTEEKVAYIKRVIHLWHDENSQIEKVLKNPEIYNRLTSSSSKISTQNIIQLLVEDGKKNPEALRNIKSFMDKRNGHNVWSESDHYGDTLESKTTSESQEKCESDFYSYLSYTTGSLLYSILKPICDDLGSFLCGSILDPPTPPSGQGTPDAFMFLDAFGKPPPFILDGNLHWIGGWEECNANTATYNYTNPKTNQTELRSFDGQYCRLEIGPPNSSINLLIGVCAPKVCSLGDVKHYFDNVDPITSWLGNITGLTINDVFCGQVTNIESDWRMQTTLSIVFILAAIAVIASIYEVFLRRRWLRKSLPNPPLKVQVFASQPPPITGIDNPAMNGGGMLPPNYVPVHNNEKNRYNSNSKDDIPKLQSQFSTVSTTQLIVEDHMETPQSPLLGKPGLGDRIEAAFLGFSAVKTLTFLFRTKTKDGYYPVLDGIRVVSLLYAILGHSYMLGLLYSETWSTQNLIRKLLEWPKTWGFQPILNFHFSADSYFVISGILVTHWWLKKCEANGNKITLKLLCYHYIHRYWRLLPGLALVIMFYMSTYRYLGNGPIFSKTISDAEYCKENWYLNLLMLGNVVNAEEGCMKWTWYVPMVFQLHIITPIALIPLVLWPIAGYAAIALLWCFHIGTTASVAWEVFTGGFGEWYFDYLMAPWCRAGPYIVGMAFGVLMFKTKCKVKLNPIIVIAGWCLSLFCLLGVQFWTWEQFKDGGEVWGRDATNAYNTLSRSAWGFGVGWIIFACSTGYGGLINSILSMKGFNTLSKLNYPTYLVHCLVIYRYYGTRHTTFYMSVNNMMHVFFGHVVMSHIYGLALSFIFYFPFIWIEKALFRYDTKLQCVTAGYYPEEKVPDYLVAMAKHEGKPRTLSNSSVKVLPSQNVYENSVPGFNFNSKPEPINSGPEPLYTEVQPRFREEVASTKF